MLFSVRLLLTPFYQADDEMEKPYLAGFEWDKDESWTSLIVHQTKQGPPQQTSGKKSKKKKNDA